MKRTMGFQKDEAIFQSEEFNDFNEFTSEIPASKIFEYAKDIQKNCEEDLYPQAWAAALKGARDGLEFWEQYGGLCIRAAGFEDYMDDGIIAELYSFFFEQNGAA